MVDDVLSTAQVAEALGLSLWWTQRLILAGRIKARKMGGQYVVGKDELARVLAARGKVGPLRPGPKPGPGQWKRRW